MNKSIRETITDLIFFLKNPRDEQNADQSVKIKIKSFFSILAIDLIAMMLLLFLINVFEKLGWYVPENHQLRNLFVIAPIWLVFILTVFIIPFIEEIVFRLFLRHKRNYLLRSIIYVFPKYKAVIFDRWVINFRYVFYLSAILFGLAHITNYDTDTTIIYIFPILLLPQFIVGVLIGYLRIKFNFILGFLFHAIHNAIFVSIALLQIEQTSNQRLNINNDKYLLKFEEVLMVNSSHINDHSQDSISFKGIDFKLIISTLTKKDYYLIDYNNQEIIEKKITLQFKNKSSKKINRDSIILKHLSDVYLFKIDKKQRSQKVYFLRVIDTLKLLKHSNSMDSDNNTSSIFTNQEGINYENITLQEIAKSLSNNYEIRFECERESGQKFNITLPNKSISKLKKTLRADYGIDIREKEKEVEYLFINFKENKRE
nr:CPBP family intramembrane glutamic endopeptidase [uncultured Flavobacterium sp.]